MRNPGQPEECVSIIFPVQGKDVCTGYERQRRRLDGLQIGHLADDDDAERPLDNGLWTPWNSHQTHMSSVPPAATRKDTVTYDVS